MIIKMRKIKHTFNSGVLIGVIASLSTAVFGYAGYYVYQDYRTQQLIKQVDEQKQQFITQLNQQFLNSDPKQNSAQQLMMILRQSSQIESKILDNLPPHPGILLQFDHWLFTAKFDASSEIPSVLAQHAIFYQPQFVSRDQPITWQCYSTLPDKLRPKDCLYTKDKPDSSGLLRHVLTNMFSDKYRYRQRTRYTPSMGNECSKFKEKLPQQFDIVAVGAYSGRKSNYQIDNSGHQAHLMEIQVQHHRPVVLILGSYEPSIWNIQWESQTEIVGVVATGHYKQRVLGLPSSIPILETTTKNSQCGYSYVSDQNAAEMNQLSQKIMQRDIQTIVIARNGYATIGNMSTTTALQSSKEKTLEDIIDKNAALAGPAGLQDAVAKGLLRPATRADIQAWKTAYNKANNIYTPPIIGGSGSSDIGSLSHNAYVVLQPMTIPEGLYGAHSANFFIPQGVSRPRGNPGHSTIHDLSSGECYGSNPDCLRP